MPPRPATINRRLEGWEKGGRVFLQDGTLYASPNCRRPVSIPAKPLCAGDPLPANQDVDLAKLKQPVWWNDSYGWMSFIPLSPTFLPYPFAALAWLPEVETVSHKGSTFYQIKRKEMEGWLRAEKCLIEAVMRLRVVYKINGTLPPVPSVTLFHTPFSSKEKLMKAIHQTRAWFVVWMGIMSYVIAEITMRNLADLANDIPCWYFKLRDSEKWWTESWLNGLTMSTVVAFEPNTLCAGVVLPWKDIRNTSYRLDFFFEHSVPVFYPWTAFEERAARDDPGLNYLEPPVSMIQEALTFMYKNPVVPLAALVICNFHFVDEESRAHYTLDDYVTLLHSASPVREFTYDYIWDYAQITEMSQLLLNSREELERQVRAVQDEEKLRVARLAQEAADVPIEAMVEEDEDVHARSELFEDFAEFFENRDARTAELIKYEGPKERERRLNRERARGIKTAEVYVWTKVTATGGKPVYLRTRVVQRWKASEFDNYHDTQMRYNAYYNEWDLCEFLDARALMPMRPYDPDESDSDDGYGSYSAHPRQLSPPRDFVPASSPVPTNTRTSHVSLSPAASASLSIGPQLPESSSSSQAVTLPSGSTGNDFEEAGATAVSLDDPWELCREQDLLQAASLGYGYVPEMGGHADGIEAGVWRVLVKNWGFCSEASQKSRTEVWSAGLEKFYKALTSKNSPIPAHLDDLNADNRRSLAHVFDFSVVSRPSDNLYVFAVAEPTSVKWVLGVETPEAAVFVMQYIVANPKATILAIGKEVISVGIPCRTLIERPFSLRQVTVAAEYTASSFRKFDYVFTDEDFVSWGCQTRQLLSQPQGRAAILRGGIIRMIAINFLSIDGALAGPSAEVSAGVGFVAPSGKDGVSYMDDQLTEREIALICGAYTMYEAGRKQYMVKYWFPPPKIWDAYAKCGLRWLEWTERNEDWFCKRWKLCRKGLAQPLTINEWAGEGRGYPATRILNTRNRARAQDFMDKHLPAPTTLPPSGGPLLDRLS